MNYFSGSGAAKLGIFYKLLGTKLRGLPALVAALKSEPGVEPLIELLQRLERLGHLLSWGHQIGDPVVEGALLLAKATSGDGHDSRFVDEVHAVHEVRRHVKPLGLSPRLLGELDTGEAVHGALDFLALGVNHLVEGLREQLRPLLEALLDLTLLPFEELEALGALPALPRRVHHEGGRYLPHRVGAEVNRFQFEQDVLREQVEVVSLHVASSETAFAHEAFGDGVHGDEFDVVPVGLSHLVQHPSEADEGAFLLVVDIVLVDLVRQHDQVLLVGNLEDVFDVFAAEHISGGVAGVDDDDGAQVDAEVLGRLDPLVNVARVYSPILIFVQEVLHHGAALQGEQRRVQGVLGDRHHDAVLRVPDQQLERELHALGGAIREVDVVGVDVELIPVSLPDEIGHLLPHVAVTLGVRVGAHRSTELG
mmetsp:Transcript_14532/g.24802  ORF Transcript_14532/g.24802 Transcript_14532/m.24802 type:complete len:422 (-) Transcript_14532:368-1633(-)